MRVDWASATDAELLAGCEEDRYRASGPGGQKRNKIESAVRLRHLPTNTMVIASESRSQHENRARALRRLRQRLAFEYRQEATGDPPAVVVQALANGKLALRPKHADFLAVASWILDLLEENRGSVSETAERLGVSTANLVDFLREPVELWRATQQIRQAHGLKALR